MTEQLFLVRHGETTHNLAGIAQGWSDSELSDRGREQVTRLAQRLRGFAPDALFSSPLKRALTTAQTIGEITGLEVRVVDELREMNYGRWEGQRFLDIRRTDHDTYTRWIAEDDFPSPDGESHTDVLARIKRALETMNGAKRPIVVTHGTAIRIATTALLDLPLSAARHFAQDNAALNVFVRRAEGWVLKLWNDTSHCDEG